MMADYLHSPPPLWEASTSDHVKETAAGSAKRKRIIKLKILAVGRFSRLFALLRYVFHRTFDQQLPLTTNVQRGVRARF